LFYIHKSDKFCATFVTHTAKSRELHGSNLFGGSGGKKVFNFLGVRPVNFANTCIQMNRPDSHQQTAGNQ